MSNALRFTGKGSAYVPGYQWTGAGGLTGAVEFYIKTMATNEVLFSTSPFLSSPLILLIDANGMLQASYTQAFSSTAHLADGEWHLVSLFSNGLPVGAGAGYQVFVDGAPVLQFHLDPSCSGIGNVSLPNLFFGADNFNQSPVAPAYSGLMSEIRVWSGGTAGFVLTPAFALRVGVPLPIANPNPNLKFYWPFWTNQPNQHIDLISQTWIGLEGPSIVSDVGQYYDDLSEIILNGTMAPFDMFTADTKGAAFAYILQQAKMNFTPVTMRQQYLQESSSASLSDWHSDVQRVSYPSAGQPAFSQEDFTYVQTRLLTELQGASAVWGFYQAAYDNNLQPLAAQYEQAASFVYSTLLDCGDFASAQGSSDLDLIVDAIAGAASFIPDAGAVISSAISVAWTVYGFSQSQPGGNPNFTASLAVEGTLGTLEASVNNVVDQIYRGAMKSVCIILGDWGLLNTAYQRSISGSFRCPPLDLDPNSKLANAVSYAATIAFSRVVLCGGFTAYQNPPTDSIVIAAPLFYYNSSFLGLERVLWGYYQADGRNGFPNYISIGQSAQDLLVNAATALGYPTFLQQELLDWPFPQS